MQYLLQGGAKTVAGLAPVGATLTPLSDGIVAHQTLERVSEDERRFERPTQEEAAAGRCIRRAAASVLYKTPTAYHCRI